MNLISSVLAVIGLGYVGLPLAVEFGKKFKVIGFDIDRERVLELQSGIDKTKEVEDVDLKSSVNLIYSSNCSDLASANTYILTVPTPIDKYKRPDLSFLLDATKLVGKYLKKGDVVIYESTVFPGATEEECVPILEKVSGLVFNEDFFVGYSPERINPGDKLNRLVNIKKVTSGSNEKTSDFVDSLYKEIILAGTYKAPSIKVAEAAKVIENTQRDVNIALINELALIFNKLDIDTQAVLDAASTKWNFLSFKPGLVGGHCISVDPYYLTYKAQSIGYHPEIILAGRRLNDSMGGYVASQLVKAMTKSKIQIQGSNILVMGMTFKENCPDLRNTRVLDIVEGLHEYGCNIDIFDPWVENKLDLFEYNFSLIDSIEYDYYDAIILAVPHDVFIDLGVSEIRKMGKKNHILYDVKHLFLKEEVDIRL